MYILIFIFGLLIGSFLNVCIHRIPLNKSLVSPRSACPYCNQPIRAIDNIPVISYLLLRGKCHHCKAPISPVYPLVELVTAALFTAVAVKFGPGWTAFVYMYLVAVLIITTAIDLNLRIIPNAITYPSMIVGLILALFSLLPMIWTDALLGGWIGSVILYLIAIVSRGGMGGGDIKLMVVIGLFLGWEKTLLTLFLAFLFGSIVGVGLMMFKDYGRKSKVPFGPFLALSALINVFWGRQIIDFYFSLWR